jgi:putative transposase
MRFGGIGGDSQIARFLIQGLNLSRRLRRMARPYSRDLRERAVARVEAGERVRLVARTLSISASSGVKWAQRFRTTGSAAAGKMGGPRRRLLVGAHAAFLRQRIAQGDFTLRSLVAELAGRGLKVDYRTVWSFVHREGLSFQKNRFGKRTRPG